ncbi:MAG: AraC family transcriptional regulator [Planctomycetota bacterium]
MRLLRELVEPDGDSGFRFLQRREPTFEFCWHHHPEFELTWIERGSGTRFVGDDIEPFESGDLILLGHQLPHTWWSPRQGAEDHVAYCVQFTANAWHGLLDVHPAARSVKRLLSDSRYGLRFPIEASEEIGSLLQRMKGAGGLARLGLLLECLDSLARSKPRRRICSRSWSSEAEGATDRIDRACQFVLERLGEPISQPEVAAEVGMGAAPFARYFRRHTGRTLTSYIQHSRISRACALLRETDESVLSIALESGFGNLSNFNRVFKRLRRVTPREYRKAFRDGQPNSTSVG